MLSPPEELPQHDLLGLFARRLGAAVQPGLQFGDGKLLPHGPRPSRRSGGPPSEEDDQHELYFMCDDLRAHILALEERGVRCSEVREVRWGSITKIRLPGGGEVGLYNPRHPFALALTSNWATTR